jgi:GMP synthase-like glutamine amidotransferase
MKVCILENDDLDPAVAPIYQGYAAMFVRLFHDAGADWTFDVFHTPSGRYPDSFDTYGAVVLTGSKADAFSDAPWIVTLRKRVTELLAQNKKLLGICFGHQLIALCLGAKVGRAPNGWGVGRMTYDWHATDLAFTPEVERVSLLVSHQDQVLELPSNARLLASNDHCPVAAYAIGQHVFCVQGHPEFVADYSGFLLERRRSQLGEILYEKAIESLQNDHDGLHVARMMVAFVENKPLCVNPVIPA